MRLKELGEGCLQIPKPLEGLEIEGLACDSRAVRPGYLFVAVDGEATDGHLYVARAEEAGAALVVGEKSPEGVHALTPGNGSATHGSIQVPYLRVADTRSVLADLAANFYRAPKDDLTLVGITGTKGKTTTSWVLDAILRHAGKLTALVGTVHNRIGRQGHSSTNTTPGCLDISRYLHDLRQQGGTHAVLEVSSHGIAQQRIRGLTFRCGVLTNVAPEHLDYHKTFEDYLEVKGRFLAALGTEAFAVLPREEEVSWKIAERVRANICWYGCDRQDGVELLRMGPGWLSFEWKGVPVSSKLWGAHNLQNILAAMTAAECIGLSRELVAAGVETAVAPPGRLEEVRHSAPFSIFVDYAHTDGALDTVLRTLRDMTRGRLITVFGCGGDRDREKRPRMGAVAEKWSDHVVVTSDNPRGEDPEKILDEISQGLKYPDDAVFAPDRREAIGLGIRMARENDIILIAGKGHETYQEVNGSRVAFDDREVAREFLDELALLED